MLAIKRWSFTHVEGTFTLVAQSCLDGVKMYRNEVNCNKLKCQSQVATSRFRRSFRRAYVGCPNQDTLLKNAVQCGNRMSEMACGNSSER